MSHKLTYKPLPPFPQTTDIQDHDVLRWFGLLTDLLPEIHVYEETLDPSSVAATTVADQTFTLVGLSTDMFVWVSPPSLDAGLLISYARVSATDTLQIRFYNTTGGAIDPASGTWRIVALRP